MSGDSFATFYQEELVALRKDAYRFGKRYPEIAGGLGIRWGDTPDPMAERVIEAMAWFAARIRRDSEARLPLAARQVLQRVHPNFVRPVPSIGIASLVTAEGFADAHPAGRMLDAGARFHCAGGTGGAGADGGVVRWRTGWPVLLSGARVRECRVGERSLDLLVGDIRELPALRLFVCGDPFVAHSLHQWVHCAAVDVLVDGGSVGRGALSPGGLSAEDLVLPRASFAHPGYQLVQEYFVCPDRFLFWDIDLSRYAGQGRERGGVAEISLRLRLPPPEGVRGDLVRFDACAVPLVNLHETVAEPVEVDHTRHSYPLVADRSAPDRAEVHSILEMDALYPGGRAFRIPCQSEARGADAGDDGGAGRRWYERRVPRVTGGGTDVELFFKFSRPEEMREAFTVSARVLCTDRGRAAAVGNSVVLENDDEMDVASAIMERPPTRQYDPPLDGGELWRLVDALTLRRGAPSWELSGENGMAAIRETLRLFIPEGCQGARAQVDGIVGWECEDTLAPLRATRLRPMGGAARGHAFVMRLDPGAFRNSSPFLFASVVESFLALFAGAGSFTRLTAYAGDDELCRWPARCGAVRL